MVNIKEFKAKLLDKKEELSLRLCALSDDLHRKKGPIPMDFSDQATFVENDEVLERLQLIEREELEQVNQALKNLEQEHYGQCKECGQHIDESRLKAMPWAPTCRFCHNQFY